MSEWIRPIECPHCGSKNMQTTSVPCAVPGLLDGKRGIFTWWVKFSCLQCHFDITPGDTECATVVKRMMGGTEEI